MRGWIIVVSALAGTGFFARADSGLSPEKIDYFDQRGYFTPDFKSAVHALVDARTAVRQANDDQKKLEHDLPGLQRQADEAEAKAVALRQDLIQYDHPEENDFAVLQGRLKDSASTLSDQIALAQAYVWTYPLSPHQGEAQMELTQLQKKLSDQTEAERQAEAARLAARAALVKRAQAHDLSLAEWRDFLRGMSQEELVKLFGQPSSRRDDYWFYTGEWVLNPALGHKVGLQVNFEAGRVITVDAKPPPP